MPHVTVDVMALASILSWAVYFGLTLATIVVDGRRQREKARVAGGVDFADRSPWAYIALGVLCGPLPVIFYFGATRKNAAGWFMGIGAAAAIYMVTIIVSIGLRAGLH